LNGLYTLKGLNASGPQAGMTRSALTLSFSTHDQVENDVKDTVYQIRSRMTLRCLNDT